MSCSEAMKVTVCTWMFYDARKSKISIRSDQKKQKTFKLKKFLINNLLWGDSQLTEIF